MILGLDIGGTKIGWALMNGSTEIVATGSIPTQAMDGGQVVASRIVDLVRDQRSAHPQISGVAIASAGVVDPDSGAIISATDTMPGWANTQLGQIVEEASGCRVHVINDVHAHGLGEAEAGAGRGYKSVMAIAVGTGIGGAHIVEGQVAFGDHYLAGHFGHIHHCAAKQMPCSCGRSGHIEAICSGYGLANWYNQRSKGFQPMVEDGAELYHRAKAGDELAKRVFCESALALGQALGSLANCIDPSAIILTGSVSKAGELWWDSVREGYRDMAMDGVANIAILPGELGSKAPFVGAAINYSRRENL